MDHARSAEAAVRFKSWHAALRFDPPHAQFEHEARARWLVSILALFALLGTLTGWWLNPDFWLDEAMLAVNIQRVPWSRLHLPLPYFEQAAPLGFLYIAKLFGTIFNYSQLGLRSFLVLFTLVGAVALYQVTRRTFGSTVAVLATALMILSPSAVEYSVQFKHYAFEMVAAIGLYALLLWIHQVGLSVHRLIVWVLVGSLATVFSNTAPLIVAVGFITLFIEGLRAQARYSVIAVVGAALCYGLFAGAYYVFLLGPSTEFQFMGYAHIYEPGFAALPPSPIWVLGKIYAITTGLLGVREPTLLRMVAGTLTLMCIGLGVVIAARRAWPVAIHIVALALLIIILSMLRKIPIIEYRHFLFVLPLLAIIIAIGVSCIIDALRKRYPKIVTERNFLTAISLIVIALGMRAVFFAATHSEREQVSPLLQVIDATPPRPLWVHYAAQPFIEYLNDSADHAPREYLGKISHESGVPGFMWRVRWNMDDYLAGVDEVAVRQPQLWLLFAHASDTTIATVVSRFSRKMQCEPAAAEIGAKLFKCDVMPRGR